MANVGEKILLQNTTSGLVYALWKREGYFWLSSNDGVVPSGQKLYGDSVEEILRDNPVLTIFKPSKS